MTDKSHALPAHMYRDPAKVLEAKEGCIERRIKDCRGCAHIMADSSTAMIIVKCTRGKKVGTKCQSWKESE